MRWVGPEAIFHRNALLRLASLLGRALGYRVHLRLGSVACWLGIQAIGASHEFLGVTSVALWIGCAIGASLIGHNCHQEH